MIRRKMAPQTGSAVDDHVAKNARNCQEPGRQGQLIWTDSPAGQAEFLLSAGQGLTGQLGLVI